GLNGAAASQWSNFAQGAATLGDVGATRAAVRRALELERNLDTVLGAAFAMVVARDVPEAQRFMAEAARLPGADAPDGQFGLKLVNVLIRLRQGDRTAVDAVPPPKSDSDMTTLFIAGMANLDGGSAEIAAARFKQIIDHGALAITWLRPVAPLFYGRALAKLGKIEDSRHAYDQFFIEFKNADSGLPILAAAKAEYARLKTAS